MTAICTIHYIDQVNALDALNCDHIQQLVDAVLNDSDYTACQLNIMFVNDEESAELHAQHFDDPTSTDVMSFPDLSFDPHSNCTHLGDLAVCVDVAAIAGPERGLSCSAEIMLYIVHGLLHILDYDDHDDEDRRIMWEQQKKIMALLDIKIFDN